MSGRSENGSGYRAHRCRAMCRGLHVAHRRTRLIPRAPMAKPSVLSQTALRGLAYVGPYYRSADRASAARLPPQTFQRYVTPRGDYINIRDIYYMIYIHSDNERGVSHDHHASLVPDPAVPLPPRSRHAIRQVTAPRHG